jgi:outer membrane lipoprotein-sorting protein
VLRTIRVCFIVLGLIGASFSAGLPSDVEATLDKFLNTITSYDNFKMEFQITAQLAGINANAGGVLLYDKSGKFKLELGQLFYLINDGNNIWFYTPLSKEYSRSDSNIQQIAQMFSPSATSPTLGPALSFLLKQIFQSEDFALQSAFLQEETLENKNSLALTFTSAKGFEVKIWLEPKSYDLQQIGVMAKIGEGQKIVVYLKVSKFSTNISLPSDAFLFVPPPGAKLKG